jgi:hypothetical protein
MVEEIHAICILPDILPHRGTTRSYYSKRMLGNASGYFGSVLRFVVCTFSSTEKKVREGIVDSATGMWAASVLLFVVGIFLVRKATVESSIFYVEIYLNFFKKIVNCVLPKKIN